MDGWMDIIIDPSINISFINSKINLSLFLAEAKMLFSTVVVV